MLPVGSELSPDVDTPAELDANSLSISAAIHLAFYCLPLTAFWFWCKLCSSGSKRCVPAPLIMHNASVNWENTNPLNTRQTKLLRLQDPTSWDDFAIAFHRNSVSCSSFIKTHFPKEGADEPGLWDLNASSKELGQRLFLEVCISSLNVIHRLSMEKPSRDTQARSTKSSIFP